MVNRRVQTRPSSFPLCCPFRYILEMRCKRCNRASVATSSRPVGLLAKALRGLLGGLRRAIDSLQRLASRARRFMSHSTESRSGPTCPRVRLARTCIYPTSVTSRTPRCRRSSTKDFMFKGCVGDKCTDPNRRSSPREVQHHDLANWKKSSHDTSSLSARSRKPTKVTEPWNCPLLVPAALEKRGNAACRPGGLGHHPSN